MGSKITDAERERIIELHAENKSRAEIAAEVGRAPDSVGRICSAAGLTFDRSRTAAATAAKQADNKARRARLIEKLYARAEKLEESLDDEFLVFSFGGRDNTYEEHTLDSPPTGDVKNVMVSIGIALQRAVDLEKVDRVNEGPGLGLLERLVAGLE